MNKIFKSKTNWTVVIMFLIGGIGSIQEMLSPTGTFIAEFLLGMSAVYFKMNPSQEYGIRKPKQIN